MILALAFALVALPAIGAREGGESEVRAADIPKDAPRFKDYPAEPYSGSNAAPDIRGDPRSRRYRTQLRDWARERPNFAGHYILATWGCGTGCTEIAVIDAVTGKIFHPPGASTNQIANVDTDLLEDVSATPRRADFGALRYRVDSRLLILFGAPEGRAENLGISYFVWEGDNLKRIRLVPGRAAR